MKKILFSLVVLLTAILFVSCDKKDEGGAGASPFVGQWILVDNDGKVVYEQDPIYGTQTVIYTFTDTRETVQYVNGTLVDGIFYYQKSAMWIDGATVDYWLEDGKFYNHLLPAGVEYTIEDATHIRIGSDTRLQKLLAIKEVDNPVANTTWAACNEQGNVEGYNDTYMVISFDAEKVTPLTIQGIMSPFEDVIVNASVLDTDEILAYSYANNVVHIAAGESTPAMDFRLVADGDADYLTYGGVKTFKHVQVTYSSK